MTHHHNGDSKPSSQSSKELDSSSRSTESTTDLSNAALSGKHEDSHRWGPPLFSPEEICAVHDPVHAQKKIIALKETPVKITSDGRHVFQQFGEDGCGEACTIMRALDLGAQRAVASRFVYNYAMWDWRVAHDLIRMGLRVLVTPLVKGEFSSPTGEIFERTKSQLSRLQRSRLRVAPEIRCDYLGSLYALIKPLEANGPIILCVSARVQTYSAGHFIIIDRIGKENGIPCVTIRDPWQGKQISIDPVSMLKRMNMPTLDLIQIESR